MKLESINKMNRLLANLEKLLNKKKIGYLIKAAYLEG